MCRKRPPAHTPISGNGTKTASAATSSRSTLRFWLPYTALIIFLRRSCGQILPLRGTLMAAKYASRVVSPCGQMTYGAKKIRARVCTAARTIPRSTSLAGWGSAACRCACSARPSSAYWCLKVPAAPYPTEPSLRRKTAQHFCPP